MVSYHANDKAIKLFIVLLDIGHAHPVHRRHIGRIDQGENSWVLTSGKLPANGLSKLKNSVER